MAELSVREYADTVFPGPSLVGPDHVPTENELNNLLYLFMGRFGIGMRTVDLMMVKLVAGPVANMAGLDTFIKAMAEYVWDHYLGESDDINEDDMVYLGGKMRDLLFSMDEKIRNDVEAKQPPPQA